MTRKSATNMNVAHEIAQFSHDELAERFGAG